VDDLKHLHDAFQNANTAAITQAISGLGGIGKTALAVEYAYRYAKDYTYRFMVNASGTTTLNDDYKRIAEYMGLTLAADAKPEAVIAAVQHWLDNNTGYLMILDNADFSADYTAKQLQEFLPHNPQGHLLITSRAQALPANLNVMANDVLALGVLSETEAVELLTTRVKGRGAILPTAEQEAALALAKELGYLALALEQAAAYIATKNTTFVAYLSLYRKESLRLLEKNKPQVGGYKQTVATTWNISFDEVAKAEPAAADLLTLCAFLAPENIPDEIVVTAASGEIESIQAFFGNLEDAEVNLARYNELLEPLMNYSLVAKDEEKATFSLHRLVQAVRKDSLSAPELLQWAETSVKTVRRAFPSAEFGTWATCERLITHCQAVIAGYPAANSDRLSLANLCAWTGYYFNSQGRSAEAEPLFEEALEIFRKALPEGHPDIATSLNNLALLYKSQGRSAEAEPLYDEALKICRKALPEGHPDIATSLNNLALLYKSQGRSAEAEPLYDEALKIWRKALPEGHPDIATSLNNLALLYKSQGRSAEAEPLYDEALKIRRKALPEGHPDIANSLNNLAELYRGQGRYGEAEPLYDEALAIRRKVLPEGHPDIAVSLNNLALSYRSQGRLTRVEPLLVEALEIWRKALPDNHPNIATVLYSLGYIYQSRGNYTKAEKLYKEVLTMRRNVLSENHPDIAETYLQLASLYQAQGRHSEAATMSYKAKQILRRR